MPSRKPTHNDRCLPGNAKALFVHQSKRDFHPRIRQGASFGHVLMLVKRIMQLRLGLAACLCVPVIALASAAAQQTLPNQPAKPSEGLPAQSPTTSPSLTVDRDPSPSIDPDVPVGAAAGTGTPGIGQVGKDQSGLYTLKTEAYEVLLPVTVLDATGRPARNLKPQAFQITEDGVPQTISSFHHDDPAVSIGLLIDSSASMFDKREAVEKAALDLVRLSNPKDEEFLVDFNRRAYVDQEFTSSIDQLQQGLRYVNAEGGTAEYDAIMASSRYLTRHSKNERQVLVLITDGADNASRTSMLEMVRHIQGLEGPVIYCVGLLFGEDSDKIAARREKALLTQLADQTGGAAFFPTSLKDVDKFAAIVAEDIRTQYTIGYRSTNPPSNGGYRSVHVDAIGDENQKLNVRTRRGYRPNGNDAKTPSPAGKTSDGKAPDSAPSDNKAPESPAPATPANKPASAVTP
jgi:Ca-activated chloride channel homolog